MKQLKLLFLLLIPYYLFAQNETEKWLEEAMAKIQENQLVGSDQSDLELDLKDWLKSPVSLNKMNANDLNKLFFLSQNQVIGILKHKEKYGPFLSVYELMAVSELDMATAKMLAKFVSIEDRQKGDYESPLNWLKGGQHEIILQEAREFIVNGAPKNDDPYVGSQDHVSFRYRFAYKTKLYLGVGLEKDPGEQWGRYADFQTFHLFYKGNGLLKTLALGDFHANFGSGLNVGTSLFNGKSALVFQTSYLQSGFKPSRSFNESGYLRGIGITLQKNKVSGSFWLSASPLSAELTADTLGVFDQISSVLSSGYHRTASELEKRKTIFQESLGLNLKYENAKLGLGYIFQKQEKIAKEFFGSNQNIMDLANWRNNSHMGLYGNYLFKNLQTHFELSAQNFQQWALQSKVIIPIHSKLDGLLLYRNYSAGFQNLFGNGWSAQSKLGNEQGLYFAFIYKPRKSHTWNLYADVFKTEIPGYQRILPAKSTDYLVTYNWSPSKTFGTELRARFQETEKNYSPESSPTLILELHKKNQYRLQLNYLFHPNWNYHFRIEWIAYKKTLQGKSNGLLVYHDINFQPKKNWHLRGRISFFDVENYDARIYMQESDLPYSFGSIMLMNKGYYYYLLGAIKINRQIDFHIKASYFSSLEINEKSSTLLTEKVEIKFQVRCKLNGI